MQACRTRVSFFAFLALLAPLAVAQDDAPGPVDKVVRLLEELSKRIEQDEAKEQQIFNKYACWCEETTHRKSQAIVASRKTLSRLGNEILSHKGSIATLAAVIAELKEGIAENLETQKQLTAIRQRENAAFLAESAEMKQAIAALEKAVIVLRDATAPTPKAEAFAEVYSSLEKLSDSSTTLTSRQLSLVSRFTSKASSSYAPQSATVQGILKDMYDTFTSDLESSIQEEARRARAYEDLIATKQKELITLRETLSKKEASKAEVETMLADATQSYEDTTALLEADEAFFDATKAACETKTREWGKRQNMRHQELDGIGEALKILSSDEATKLFKTSIKAGIKTGTFLQLNSISSSRAPAVDAYRALQSSARKAHSLRLASLAAKVSASASGHFDAVINAIDTMIGDLQQEGQDDIRQRDQCKDDLHNIASRIGDVSWKIDNNNAKITKLEHLVAAREAEKTMTIEEIQSVNKEISDMEAQRKSENAEFLQAKSDDEKAIELLDQAKAALQKYFEKNDIELGPTTDTRHAPALVQGNEPGPVFEGAAPDARLSKNDSRKTESKGIISILNMIIEDLQDEIKQSRSGEEAAQLDFEKRLADGQKLRAALSDKKINLEGTIADRNQEITDEQSTLSENEKDLADQQQLEKDTLPDCDWIKKNFSERSRKREIEVQGLMTAKAYLAGQQATVVSMSQTGTHQHPGSFDDEKFGRIDFKALSFLHRL